LISNKLGIALYLLSLSGMIDHSSKWQQALDLLRTQGLLRPADLQRKGLPPDYLREFKRRKLAEVVARGTYAPINHHLTENHSYAVVAKRVPHGVICLLSALSFHRLTTQNPSQVWLAVDQKAWAPRLSYPPIRLVRFSGEALTAGVEEHSVEGVKLHVYNVAKTIADLFKFRYKIGLDVAMEALRDGLKARRTTRDEIMHHARICRVAKVMQPYLESEAFL
jgi:predicted transcriptional regulator of viral defense system